MTYSKTPFFRKNYLRLLDIYARVLRRVRLINSKNNNPYPSVLILPPADAGSLGDEAMMVAVVEQFKKQEISEFGFIAFETEPPCMHLYPKAKIVMVASYYDFIQRVSRYGYFCCLGADMMDGYYSESSTLFRLKLVELAAKTGAKTSVFGFSVNKSPKSKCIEALKKLPTEVRLFVRDPVSYQRLESYINRPFCLVADLAFLLPPAKKSEIVTEVLNWIVNQQKSGRIVLGINANSKIAMNISEDKDLIKLYADSITKLCAKNDKLSFLFIPHDFRNSSKDLSDVLFAQNIFDSLPIDLKSRCSIVSTPCNAADIKGICGGLDMVISARMHLAIASLGQGTPTACITYQGKFEGLFKHFELEGMAIEPELAFQKDGFVDFILPLIENRSSIQMQIESKLPHIKQLSLTNFQ